MTAEGLSIRLEDLGWDTFFDDEFRNTGIEEAVPARIITQHKSLCMVHGGHGEMAATIAGRLRYRTDTDLAYPVTGDWVAICPQPDASPRAAGRSSR